ncbi:hypothetical protein Tco_1522688 [Tanacetum coccineum]
MSNLKYTLTVNPIIYTSCIKQFWATAKAKTVNGEVQIQALVDGKKVIVTETSVRRAIQLKDAEGTECLPNVTIFEQLTLMGYENLTQKLTFYKAFFSPQWKFVIYTILQCLSAKTTAWNEFSSTMASAISILPQTKNLTFPTPEELGEGLEIPIDPQHTPNGEGCRTLRDPQPSVLQTNTDEAQIKKQKPRKTKKQNTEVSQPSDPTEPMADETKIVESVPTHSNDPLISGEDRLKLNELMELCISLSQRVITLETTKTNQALEIDSLKGESTEVVSSEDEGLGAQEDASKQGRKIDDLDADAEEVKVEKAVSTTEVTTVSATTTTVDELTLAQTLIEIKAAKPKAVTTAATTTTTTVTRPKARGVVVQEPKMIEPEKPLKNKDQILIDEEIAQKLQSRLNAELEEEEKLAKKEKKMQTLLNGIISWIKERNILQDLEQRRKAPTKAQKRNQMCTYLKNMAAFTHSQLKNKSFDEVQKAFDKTIGWIDSFVSMDSEVVKGGKEKDEGSVTIAEENSSKRAGTELEQERIKKQKIDGDQEEAEMKKHMEIFVDEEEITVDAIPLATKPPIIVD